MMTKHDTYSLSENSKRYGTLRELFIKLEDREPVAGEYMSCYEHCSITGRSFLATFDVVVKEVE